MVDVLVVAPGIVVPGEAMRLHAARSGGPGGQNVNKVSSKVELRVDARAITGLDAPARERLFALTARARDADGWILVTSQRTRDQRANLEDARDKIRALVRRAMEAPKRRRKTKPTRASVERRIEDKRRRARAKAARSRDEG